ncbi:MAG: aminotransferase [Alphaproteobacteria bacterium]
MADNTARNLSLEDMDRQHFMHPSTSLHDHVKGTPRIMESAKGITITDSTGRTFIDGFGGLYCVNIGYGRTEIAEAIYEQAKKLAYYHVYASHSNEPAIRLADRVIRLAPPNMARVYFGLSGSDANETNVKLAWYYNNLRGQPKRTKIISRWRGYHGSTVMAGSLTGLPIFHNYFNLPVGPVLHVATPHYYYGAEPGMSELDYSKKLAADLEATILKEGPETVAAFIGEPVMGTGGIIVPPEGYWGEVQKVLKKYDILLIVDEVICGFGRLGEMFGCNVYDIEPDLITVAKGLTSAYQPLSGAIVSDKICAVIQEKSAEIGAMGHGYTYSGHPCAAAAGLANLDILEKEGMVGNAKKLGAYMNEELKKNFADHPLVGEVRGKGLLAGIEFVANKKTKQRFEPKHKIGIRVSGECLAESLIARAMPNGDLLAFSPPLCITKSEVDEIIARTKRALDRAAGAFRKEGIWQG